MASNTMMFAVIIMAVVGIGGVFLITRKKSSSTELQVDINGKVVKPMQITYDPKALAPSGPLFIPGDTLKPLVPITGGSRFGRGPGKFAFNALGTCQCDEDKCCYKSVYQPRRGGPETEKECRDVFYGDPVDACERAVEAFNEEVSFNESFLARVPRSRAVRAATAIRKANIFST